MSLTTFYFWSLGLWTTVPPMVVIWIAVEDLLCGVLWSSTVVLVSYSIPDIVSKCLSPLVVRRISFTTSFVLLTVLLSGSVASVVCIDDVRVRIIGVGLLGFANGFTVITCVRMLAYYQEAENVASAFQNGSNFSSLFASIGYTGLTTWLGVRPRIVIACTIPMCFFPLVVYFLLDRRPLTAHLQTSPYKALKTDMASKEDDSHELTAPPASVNTLEFLIKVFPFVSYAFLDNFCLHFSTVTVLTTLTFPSSPFPPRDHYVYYRLVSDGGIFLSGASTVVSYLNPGCNDVLGRICKTWFLVLLHTSHLFVFVLASWYRFLPNIVFVLVMCLTQGIVHGLILIYTLMDAAILFPSPKDNGTAMGLLEVGISVGRIAASILGIFTEKQLRNHCTNSLLLGRYCLARHKVC